MTDLDAMGKALLEFYNALDSLRERYDEITDSEVRDSLHIVLSRHFIWGNPYDKSIVSFGMFSQAADNELERCFSRFLQNVEAAEVGHQIQPGQARLRFLQNNELRTSNNHMYDEYIGHLDQPLANEPLPDYLFEVGDYDQ